MPERTRLRRLMGALMAATLLIGLPARGQEATDRPAATTPGATTLGATTLGATTLGKAAVKKNTAAVRPRYRVIPLPPPPAPPPPDAAALPPAIETEGLPPDTAAIIAPGVPRLPEPAALSPPPPPPAATTATAPSSHPAGAPRHDPIAS